MGLIYSEFAIASQSASITSLWQRLKGRQGMQRLYSGGGGGGLTRKGASSVIGLGEIIQLFLVRPELEAREKIKET